MRNFKKLSALVVATALVLTSIVPAFAYTPVNDDKAEILRQLEIYQGISTDSFVPALDQDLTRGQGALLLARLFNKEADIEKMTDAEATEVLKDFADGSDVPAYVKKAVAYFVENKVINGASNNGVLTIDEAGSLYAEQFAALILRQMGYQDSHYTKAIEELAAVEGVAGLDSYTSLAGSEIKRDHAVGVMYGSLTGKYEGETATVISKIVEAKPNLKEVAEKYGLIEAVVTAFEVESLSSNNLREVFVKFTKALDKTTAEDKANYTITAKSGAATLSKATLLEDGKTVKLTLDSAQQQSNLDIKVANVKDSVGTVITTTTKSIVLFDTSIPEATEYKFTGPTTIEVTFSEPIDSVASSLTVVVDNGIYGASAKVKTGDEYTVEVTLGTVLPEGAHSMKIGGAKDFAGYTSLDKTFEVTYVKDTTAPTVAIESATQTKVTLSFNKAVKGDALTTAYFYHTYTAYAPDSVTDADGNVIVASNYYDKVIVNFTSKPLPAGSTNVVVLKKVGDISITDRYGNVMANDTTLTAKIEADTTAPTITKVEATNESTVVITFSEDVTGAKEKSNYVFKNSEGKTIAADKYNEPNYDSAKKQVTVTFINQLTGGAYSVELKNIKDASLNANAMVTVAHPFTVTDKTAITTATAVKVESTGTNADIIYVTFPENMAVTGNNSVLNLSNYKLGATAEAATELPEGTTITIFGTNDKVKITVPGTSNTDLESKNLYVRNVADASGNVMTSMFLQVTLAADTAPVITEVKTVALNKLELKVDKHLSSVNASDIKVGGEQVGQATFVNNTDGTATITVVLTDATKLLNSGALPTEIEITDGGNIKSITGTAMVANANIVGGVTLKDGIAATVVEIRYDETTGKIEVEFSENLEENTFAGVGNNGFSVSGGTITSAKLGSSANIVELTSSSNDFNAETDVIYTAGNIADAAGNLVSSFTHTDTLK